MFFIIIFLLIMFILFSVLRKHKYRKNKHYQKLIISFQEEISKIITTLVSLSIRDGKRLIENNLTYRKNLINLLTSTTGFPFTINNKTKVLSTSRNTFTSFFQAIKEAREHIHLEFYIFRDDHIGKEMQKLLIEKALQGVKVRLIYDGYGSRGLKKSFLRKFQESGIQTACFSPVTFPFLNRRIHYRNHRKILIVDGRIGFVGGINIGDEYLGSSENFSDWRDTHIKIEGDAVKILQSIFLQDWYLITKEKLVDNSYFPKLEIPVGEELIQIGASGPDSPWKPIMQMYFSMIATAQESIYLTTPYFIPNESILTALKNAALSGLDVRIIIPGKPDNRFVFWASFSYLKDLLPAGVRVYQYQKGFIHSKTLIVDSLISSVGTANLDRRSFNLNYEVNAFLYSQKIAQRLVNDFFLNLKESKEISYTDYEKRPLTMKLLESFARLFSPLL